MSSLVRRIEIAIMKKANVNKVYNHTIINRFGIKERIFFWPRLIPISAMPEKVSRR